MKALVLEEYHRLVYTDFPEPRAGEGEVLVAVRACGICGSDVHGLDGSTGRRRPPIVMGHEAAGVVADAHSSVSDWKPGDRVTFDSTVYCGDCWYCRRGLVNLCDRRMVLGVSCGDYRRHGAFAECVSVPSRILYRLPEEVSFEQAAMVEAVSVAVHAVARSSVRSGDSAVVVGAGMIGLLVIQALRVTGCRPVLALDIAEPRLELARQLGADAVVPADEKATATVLELTCGRGADASFEVVGTGPALRTALGCLRKGGSATLVGNLSARVELPLQEAVTRELQLIGSCASAGEYPRSLEMIARGLIRVDLLISAVAPLADGAEWFRRLYGRDPGLMKVVLTP